MQQVGLRPWQKTSSREKKKKKNHPHEKQHSSWSHPSDPVGTGYTGGWYHTSLEMGSKSALGTWKRVGLCKPGTTGGHTLDKQPDFLALQPNA